MENSSAEKCLARYKHLKKEWDQFAPLWQDIGDYFHNRKNSFINSSSKGEFTTRYRFETNGIKANEKFANSLVGMLWPNGANGMKLVPPMQLAKSTSVKQYFEKINRVTINEIDNPKAGFTTALSEYALDQGSFGTSGIGIFKGKESALKFKSYGVEDCVLERDKDGNIIAMYMTPYFTVNMVVKAFGEDALTSEQKRMYKSGQGDEEVKILYALEENQSSGMKKGLLGMPYHGKFINMDTKKIMKTDGYTSFPIKWVLFSSRRDETYGRSPAMNALPDVLEADATRQIRMVAMERKLDPTLGVYDDSMMGNGVIDKTSGSINVFKRDSRLGSNPPVFKLYDVGDIREADKSIEDLKQSITEHFYLDVFLDFNNQTQMTATETDYRYSIRKQALGAIFSNQLNNLFVPLIEDAVEHLFNMGKLGYVENDPRIEIEKQNGLDPIIIPDEIAKIIKAGEQFYEINFLTQAAAVNKSGRADSTVRVLQSAMEIAQIDPTALDVINFENALKVIQDSYNAPSEILNSEEEIQMIREQRQAQQQQQMEMEQIKMASEAARNVGVNVGNNQQNQ